MTYLEGLQTTLAAEHAAVHVLGYLGGLTSEAATPDLWSALRRSYDYHRAGRDELARLVRDLDAEPVAAEPTYELPDVGAGPDDVASAGVQIERGVGRAYTYLISQSVPEMRAFPVGQLLACAERELRFGGRPRAFPGR